MAIILVFTLLFLSACKKEAINQKKSFGPDFNLDKFEDELKASIQPSGAIGWTYIISQNGLFARGGGFGKARNNADGNRAMNINTKVNMASISKFLTATAVMQLLERRNLTVDSKIGQWLPNNWNQGPGVSQLSFREILGHTSGLSSVNTQFSRTLGYTGLRKMIDTGVIRSKTYTYLNANYALCRILIPSLWKGLNDAPLMLILDSATTEKNYEKYMQKHIFEPIGLSNITCEPEDRSICTLYYSTTDGETNNGLYYGSW
ncbi:MAG: serine hydrolase, partial [Bacteroidia bacterium]